MISDKIHKSVRNNLMKRFTNGLSSYWEAISQKLKVSVVKSMKKRSLAEASGIMPQIRSMDLM